MGKVTQANYPLPGIVKAVKFFESSLNFICKIPEVKSSIEKFALPMSPMHSVISFMLYLSICEWLLSSLKSWTILNPYPCFLGTRNRGELYREFVHLTTPKLSHSSNVASMKL